MNFLANFKPKDFYKHDASAVNYPLNEPDDQYVGINRDESYLDALILDTCLYRICIDQTVRKPMQYNKGIVPLILLRESRDTQAMDLMRTAISLLTIGMARPMILINHWQPEKRIFPKGGISCSKSMTKASYRLA